MSTPENPKAFPWPQGEGYGEGGMTLRDWFAGQALSALIEYKPTAAARLAYEHADALLAARSKGGPQP